MEFALYKWASRTCFSCQGLADSGRAAKKDDNALPYYCCQLCSLYGLPLAQILTLLLNKVVECSLAMSSSICEREYKVPFSWRKHQVLERRFVPTCISDIIDIELAYMQVSFRKHLRMTKGCPCVAKAGTGVLTPLL
jgi:hypothetical protein